MHPSCRLACFERLAPVRKLYEAACAVACNKSPVAGKVPDTVLGNRNLPKQSRPKLQQG